MLQGVLDSARALTDARYGALTLFGDAVELPTDWDRTVKAPRAGGPMMDFYSSGVTGEQILQMKDMPDRMLIFDYLRRLPWEEGHRRVPVDHDGAARRESAHADRLFGSEHHKQSVERGGDGRLPKPWGRDQLLNTLRDVVEGRCRSSPERHGVELHPGGRR